MEKTNLKKTNAVWACLMGTDQYKKIISENLFNYMFRDNTCPSYRTVIMGAGFGFRTKEGHSLLSNDLDYDILDSRIMEIYEGRRPDVEAYRPVHNLIQVSVTLSSLRIQKRYWKKYSEKTVKDFRKAWRERKENRWTIA